MRIYTIIISLIIGSLSYIANAQFYTSGDDPGRIKWSKFSSENYIVIYPTGLDSLAREYALNLEKYRKPISRSVGYTPGEYTRGKMPVILHSYNAIANGSVAWAPKRMDLFTTPSAYDPEPMPWIQNLAVHESRHVAQMQFGLSYAFRPFNWFLGEMFNGAMAGLYAGLWFLEGDAVVTETALTKAGRGRSGVFLNYYMMSFDNGDFRSWERWLNGSYKYNSPNHYALGYLTIGGLRYFYDAVDYSENYLKRTAKRPYDIMYKTKSTRDYTGKNWKESFDTIMRQHHRLWQEEIENRKPFLPSERVSKESKYYTEYSGIIIVGRDIYAVKESFVNSHALIKIDSTGKEIYICPFASETGTFHYTPRSNGLYWSETVADHRWGQNYKSHLRFYNFDTYSKKTVSKDRLLYNPIPAPNDNYILATEYTPDGRSHISIANDENLDFNHRFTAPDSIQFVHAAIMENDVYACGITDNGYGIGKLTSFPNNTWEEVLAPSPVMIKDFGCEGDELTFTSDRTGVDEFYHMDPETGEVTQKTSFRYGAYSFHYCEDNYLYYSQPNIDGVHIMRTHIDSLLNRKVDFFDRHSYRIADRLTEQELALAAVAENTESTELSEPEKYNKALNLPNIHSWAPIYFDIDNTMSMSFDKIYDVASLGVTGITQNQLGTGYGQIGYSAHPDPYAKGKWRHSGHLRFRYSGLYPIFDLSLDLNDRASIQYNNRSIHNPSAGILTRTLEGELTENPYFKGNIDISVPINLSSGGWQRGFIPKLSWSFSNDVYNIWDNNTTATETFGNQVGIIESMTTASDAKFIYSNRLNFSARTYIMRPTAHAGVYPKLGIGLEAGVAGDLGLAKYINPSFYLYTYAYTPGILPDQGLKISILWQESLKKDAYFTSRIVNTLPRGLSANSDVLRDVTAFNSSLKLSLDYAVPIYAGDFNLIEMFYGKRVIITPHFDYSYLKNNGGLYSVGTSVALEFGRFFWIRTPIEIGVTYSYNNGSAFKNIKNIGYNLGHHYVGPVFNITLPQ